jgi:hypothetical protein
MRKSAVALAALGLLSAFTAIAPAPAEARDWDHGWRGEEWREPHDQGAAIALGVIGGILTGAAIASTQPYAPPAYYYPPAYYGAPYAGYGYYR